MEHSAVTIALLTAVEGQAALTELVALLQDAVASGASVGFLPPLPEAEARTYWGHSLAEVAQGTRLLLVARQAGRIVGAVQLALATMPNAQHRAEVQKLCVLQYARQHGLGRALMNAVEEAARAAGRSLLVLDTRHGDVAEQLYLKCGYIRAGTIPYYAQSATGTLDATVIMYRQL